MNTNYLQHYGVKGMRWGHRKKYEKKGRHKKGLSDKQKKYIKIGAAAVGTALVAYGGYKLYKKGVFDEYIDEGKYHVNQVLIKNRSYDEDTSLMLKKGKDSILKDLKAVNPNFDINLDNEWSNNCGNCSIAFELRRRGYDVHALGNSLGVRISQLGEFFKGFKSESFIQMTVDDNIQSLSGSDKGKAIKNLISSNIQKQYKDDARGALFFPMNNASHYINWIKENGQVSFYDAQNPNYDINELFKLYKYNRNSVGAALTSIRLDDLDITNGIHKMVANKGTSVVRSDFDPLIDKGANWVSENWLKKAIA